MVIDIAILAGIAITGYLNWRLQGDVDDLGEVVAHLLIELGEKGIIQTKIETDD